MKNCIVLGSGRSGTSMLAGTLSGAGYYMGDEMMPPTPGNPKGYFEAFDIEAINEDILANIVPKRPKGRLRKFFSHRPRRSQRWLAYVRLNKKINAKESISKRIEKKVNQKSYCFKDPRFCYTLPVWKKHFSNEVYFCIFRNPEITVASILKECQREDYLQDLKINRKKIFKVWASMYEHILNIHSKSGIWYFFHYEQIFNDKVLKKIEGIIDATIDHNFPEKKLNRVKKSIAVAVDRKYQKIYRELCIKAGFNGQ